MVMVNGRLSKQEKEQLLELRQDGHTYKQIGEMLGISVNCVCYHCNPNRRKARKLAATKFNNSSKGKERYKIYHRTSERRRSLTIWVNGEKRKITGLNKRPYPRCCELCGREGYRLYYHHWDSTNLNLGMWLCNPCHQFAEGVDKNYVPKYKQLKIGIEVAR